MIVADTDRGPIQLWLRHEIDLRDFSASGSQTMRHAIAEQLERVCVERILEREHGYCVSDRRKLGGWRGTDALSGRIGRYQHGMLRLDLAQSQHQPIVLGVGNGRFIKHEVSVIVLFDRSPQARMLGDDGLGAGLRR